MPITPAKPDSLHRTLNVPALRLIDIPCHREQRYVGAHLTLSYDRQQVILERDEVSEELAGKYVELYDYPGQASRGAMEGCLSSLSRFQQRPACDTHRHVENKRLSHALNIVKAQQDLKRETNVMTSSEKTGYIYGPDFVEKMRSRAAVEMTV